MTRLGIEERVVDNNALSRTVQYFRDRGIVLPTFAELADPAQISPSILERLETVDPDEAHPLNLFRVHWYNSRRFSKHARVPPHLVLHESLTGVPAKIVIALGDRFPMIHAHKVLAAYGCLVPRLVTGQFDPTRHRALWPSTGNYCRGGVAISRILGCRGVAILPEGMSRERFAWLERWTLDPNTDIVRTPGKESDVKEIYDTCDALEAKDPANVVFNQFAELSNHLVHRVVTGQALGHIFEYLAEQNPALRLAAFVSATGSAGTIGAGDTLKERFGARIVAVEALECPTLLYNGFGSHNIQGIGDKHIPLIHNVMNTDIVAGVSDSATDALFLLFNDPIGHAYLRDRRGVPEEIIAELRSFGISSICNIIAAIKTARRLNLGPEDAVFTIATDGAPLYESEIPRILGDRFDGDFDAVRASETFGQYILGANSEHLLELSGADRNRIFNLGYFTWVEQRGVSLAEFEARRDLGFWRKLIRLPGIWDNLITELNERVGTLP